MLFAEHREFFAKCCGIRINSIQMQAAESGALNQAFGRCLG